MVTPESTTHHADMSRLLIMVTLLVALPQTAGSRSAAAEQVVLSGPTMGTTYHVKFVPKQSREAYADLPERIHAVLEEINGQMSTYRTDSEVSRFNRAPADEWFSVSSATAMVAATALEISRQTDGALDVTVGPLVRLWHFGPPADELDETTRTQLKPPNDEALQAAIARVGYQKLAVRH
ncbi:MAG: FAD:protein FMN transferase, partial [Planctomycetes bacterium]|nr:FAD:protein FMN transferase [Planctomycetota bacterium]